jgi:hypothetical protein
MGGTSFGSSLGGGLGSGMGGGLGSGGSGLGVFGSTAANTSNVFGGRTSSFPTSPSLGRTQSTQQVCHTKQLTV